MSIVNIHVLKKFLENNYARHLVFKTNNIEVLLVCWLPGQGAELHEHGNSDALTLVIDGKLSYTNLYPDGTKVSGVLLPGDVEHIPPGIKHEVRNNSNENLVTLHIYSPPLELETLSSSLGYANKIKLQEISLLEKKVKYLMADSQVDVLSNLEKITKELTKKLQSNKRQKSVSKGSKRVTITIIGGGFSGALLATQLIKQAPSIPLQILLIERAPKFARGFAYSTNSPMHLLNVPAGKMSAFPDDPNHFLKWILQREPNTKPETFVPRMLYGEYLETILHEAELNKPNNVVFKRLSDEAVSIEVNSNNLVTVFLESGIHLPTNFVAFAVGNYPPRNLKVLHSSFYKSKRYVRDPWSIHSLSMVSPDDSVLLVGTGLTMIDKAVELKCKGHRGKIYAVSRHGLIPQPHNLNIKNIPISFEFDEKLTTLGLLKMVRKKIKEVTKQGGDWRSVIDTLRPSVQKLWVLLPLKEKNRFFRYLRPYWDIHRHRMPHEVASIIQNMLNTGQLKVIACRIKDYKEDDSFIDVVIEERGNNEQTVLQVARVINCTGSEVDFCQIEDPLIVNLLEQGIILPDKLSLGLEAGKTGALISKDGMPSEVFYTLGPPLKGLLWETTAVPEIREQAYLLAKEIAQKSSHLYEEFLSARSSEENLLSYEFDYAI